jgi:hypothetical protein
MIRRILLITCLLVIVQNATAKFTAYYPSGKKINIKFETVGELLDSLNILEYDVYDTKYGSAYFKRLTNKPVFVFFFDKEEPLKVQQIISSFNYKGYLNSYSYYYDLKDMIKKGTLTKEYLLDVFNEPDTKEYNRTAETLIFKKYNCSVTFQGDKAISANVIDFKSLDKYQFAIVKYDVTGDDDEIGFEITVKNFSDKPIDNIHITVTAKNSMQSKIQTKTIEINGPIRPSETSTYEFNSIIYSDFAKYLPIENIKIKYVDGSSKLIGKAELPKITLVDWEEEGKRTINDL